MILTLSVYCWSELLLPLHHRQCLIFVLRIMLQYWTSHNQQTEGEGQCADRAGWSKANTAVFFLKATQNSLTSNEQIQRREPKTHCELKLRLKTSTPTFSSNDISDADFCPLYGQSHASKQEQIKKRLRRIYLADSAERLKSYKHATNPQKWKWNNTVRKICFKNLVYVNMWACVLCCPADEKWL